MSKPCDFFGGGSTPALIPRKNYIINGGFQIWQRGTTFTGPAQYCADRWSALLPDNNVLSSSSGDYNHIILERTTERTSFRIAQGIELDTGAASPFKQGATFTLSFQVNVDEVIGNPASSFVQIGYVSDVTTGADLVTEYTNTKALPAYGTWVDVVETFTLITQPASPTTSLRVYIGSLFDALAPVGTRTRIRNVKLEVGESATPFEYPDVGEETALCQRYYQALEGQAAAYRYSGASTSSAVEGCSWALPVKMRTTPVCSYTGYTATNCTFNNITGRRDRISVTVVPNLQPTSYRIYGGVLTADAEL